MIDNFFTPREIHIEPGDTVVWRNSGRNVHDVASDIPGQFRSGDLIRGKTFSHTFTKEGYYYYHCANHGGAGQTGMWGLVIVGDPPEPEPPPKDPRPTLRVPKDFPTIQKAVDRAKAGTKILVSPGVYRESVVVRTERLAIVGVDRFRTILNGQDTKAVGIQVSGVSGVTVKNLTVRNYSDTGVLFDLATVYSAIRVDAIKNRSYGIRASDSYNGVIRDSFAWGSGSAGVAVTHCPDCAALVDGVTARKNFIGYWGANATGVVVRGSLFRNNGAGAISATLPDPDHPANRGHTFIANGVRGNNYSTIPAAGLSEEYAIPFGTGIWLLGARNNLVLENEVELNTRFGIVVSQGLEEGDVPKNDRVADNVVSTPEGTDLAWDGMGENVCFENNTFATSAPENIELTYGCDDRPFAGVPYAPVHDEAVLGPADPSRTQAEPPMPHRPKCQRGAPGCTL